MIFDVYSIRDVKSGYSLPITEMNDAVAMRNFANDDF
nr:MAG TPA: DNA binding protein [Microviridae sp.]